MRRKGKVHPSPSSSTSPSYTINKDDLSVLKLLPVAILTIVSVLSLEDRQVLAYMIARSIKSSSTTNVYHNKNTTKSASSSLSCTGTTPIFHCECFDCYTSYWFRWDSSPNRELIHQAIEAFEEGEQPRKGKNKKKDKIGRRGGAGKMVEIEAGGLLYQSPEICVNPTSLEPVLTQLVEESTDFVTENGEQNVELLLSDSEQVSLDDEVLPETAVELCCGGGNSHKGLARKVLPDVLGLFNSRLWNLLSPNV